MPRFWIGARPGNVAATGLFDEVGFFTEALSEDELNDVMDDGLAGYAAVEAAGKLATTWALLKAKNKNQAHPCAVVEMEKNALCKCT